MALSDNLISYWKLDEASGNFLDAHSTNDLTDVNSTGSAAGKINNGRDFESSTSQYGNRASNAALQTGDIDYSVFCWVNAETIGGGVYYIIGAKDNISVSREWLLLSDPTVSGKFTFAANDGSTSNIGVVSWSSAPSTATWYFLAAGHSAASNEVWISVNGGTPVTSATSGAAGAGSANFSIGAGYTSSSAWAFFDGIIDEFAFFKRDIRSDLATFYNSGSGKPYSDIVAGSGATASTLCLLGVG